MCSWYEASARATKGETCADQMSDSFQAHKDDAAILESCWPLSKARDVTALYVQCLWVHCLHTPSIFLDFFQGNRNHHHFSVGCHELQLVCHCEVGTNISTSFVTLFLSPFILQFHL